MTNHAQHFNTFLKEHLNKEQQTAVKHKSGPLLVIAGAGSGKTRVITSRITNLILNEDILPSAIVALTFTNKAANEMKKRITTFLGDNKQLPFIGTFHAYCLQILKRYPELIDMPFFSILDEDDQQRLLHNIIQRNNLSKKVTAKQLRYQISQIKNNAVQSEKINELYAVNPLLHDVYTAYEQEKKASKCLDFDDLLLEVLKLFRTNKDFKRGIQETIRHLLVDEYQDTNGVQHELLKHIAQHTHDKASTRTKQTTDQKQKKKNTFAIDSICIVGDEDQSIYSWRGATVANILNFKKDFPKTTTIKIEQNYRSVQPILTVAHQVIQHNRKRNPKELWSSKTGTNRINSLACLSEYQEGEALAYLLKTIAKKNKLTSVAILYRAHFQSRAIEEALIKHSIPYKIIGGIQFYARKEIKDILAYLRLIVNPFDRTSLFRVINCPSRGLGAAFEDTFYTRWLHEPFCTFKDIAQKLLEEETLTRTKKASLTHFISCFDNLHPSDKPSKAIEQIITTIGYINHLKKTYDHEEAEERIANIKELINALNHFETQEITTLTQLLDEIALMQEKTTAQNKEEHNAVVLMTLHAAKGLEFDVVIIAGLEEGLLPSSRSLTNDDSLEEERRLLYVGITRAKEYLLLTRARYRYSFGQMTDQQASRFLHEIPKKLLPLNDCSYWSPEQLQTFFAHWFGIKVPSQSSVMTFKPARVQNKEPATQKQYAATNSKKMWKKNQPVKHKTFGIGIIQSVEKKSDTTVYITVQFKRGKKKIAAQFLQSI